MRDLIYASTYLLSIVGFAAIPLAFWILLRSGPTR